MSLTDAEYVHKLEQTGAATRQIAEVVGQFLSQLLEEGFTQEGAEHLCDTLMIAIMHHE